MAVQMFRKGLVDEPDYPFRELFAIRGRPVHEFDLDPSPAIMFSAGSSPFWRVADQPLGIGMEKPRSLSTKTRGASWAGTGKRNRTANSTFMTQPI